MGVRRISGREDRKECGEIRVGVTVIVVGVLKGL